MCYKYDAKHVVYITCMVDLINLMTKRVKKVFSVQFRLGV